METVNRLGREPHSAVTIGGADYSIKCIFQDKYSPLTSNVVINVHDLLSGKWRSFSVNTYRITYTNSILNAILTTFAATNAGNLPTS